MFSYTLPKFKSQTHEDNSGIFRYLRRRKIWRNGLQINPIPVHIVARKIKRPITQLSRRERQILELAYQLGRIRVKDVLRELPDPPGYSAVRTFLRILEEKGHVTHDVEGREYVYRPLAPKTDASKGNLRRLIKSYYDNSPFLFLRNILDASQPDDPMPLETLTSLAERLRKYLGKLEKNNPDPNADQDY